MSDIQALQSVPQQKFERDDTKAVKGIAVLLMLFHHLAGFPDRFPVGFDGFSSILPHTLTGGGILQTFALTANFCVCLYFFLGGYGLYKRWSKGKFQVADAVTALYKAYWKVFALFIPIAFLCFSRTGDGINALCTRYVFTDVKSLITTILCDASGWSCSLNSEWWFFGSYVCVLPMGYLFCCAIRRHQNFWVDLFLVFGFDLCISGIFPCIARTEIFAPLSYHVFYSRFLLISGMASTFFAGIVLAKYDAVCRMKARLLTLPFPVACSCLGVAVLYWFRAFVASGSMDILYCALMVPMLSVVLDRLRPAKRFLGLLGKHSTNMWLTHSFFAYYFLETTFLVYATRNVWVDLAILTALSFAASVFVNWFWNAGTKSFRIAGKTS